MGRIQVIVSSNATGRHSIEMRFSESARSCWGDQQLVEDGGAALFQFFQSHLLRLLILGRCDAAEDEHQCKRCEHETNHEYACSRCTINTVEKSRSIPILVGPVKLMSRLTGPGKNEPQDSDWFSRSFFLTH